MSGKELIDRIAKELEREKVPPTDAAIMQKLRDMRDIYQETSPRWSGK